ncbi:hypothetical protein [Rubinisphaera sp.]|uniref:hypothetical protein n=1 Tax=Rubinisphaera sp. TaxID=2024857 RepID=UPI000C0E3EC6|nr:hypothetical protein [Rubinisphaera sp.]MBV11523.1 hypothetical protein [Rubinisphaera sp.]HCS52954.1 hypothetical protein [Planctomycetaceae bacterium]
MSTPGNRMTLPNASDSGDLTLGVTPGPGSGGEVTARRAGQITDMMLPVSPSKVGATLAMRNMAKAINLALLTDFLETELDNVYKGARVRKGTVQILHQDYIGLGDGFFAQVGKLNKSFQLTLKGPDAASPEGKKLIKENKGGMISGIFDLLGRKLNLLQEYEDKVPVYLGQTLDRLEAKRIITEWNSDEWLIETSTIGLDVMMTPVSEEKPE